LSLAFHPSYPAVPWFFVYYTNKDPANGAVGDVVLARYSVSANPNVADAASVRILLTIPHSLQSNHNGGSLQFSPVDGFLYVSIGDGGGGCDNTSPGCNAQRDDSLLGKILRIDVNSDVAPFYTIPPSNPFATPGTPRDEIWAKGVRNPFRTSFDRANGNFWIGDVGQSSREEVDFQPAGAAGGRNYGWKVMEGRLCNTCSLTDCGTPLPACNDAAITPPIHDYERSVGFGVIGGYVYRGSRLPTLAGCYLFGDLGGPIWALDPAAPDTRRTLLTGIANLTTFGEDTNGEVYLSSGNAIYQIVPASAVPAASSTHLAVALAGMLFAGSVLAKRLRRAA
jgi:glucose/arabinose dehydrogenase